MKSDKESIMLKRTKWLFGGTLMTLLVLLLSTQVMATTTWQQVTGVGLPTSGGALAFHPSDPLTIYMGKSGVVYKSIDGGTSWSSSSIGSSSRIILKIAIDPVDPQILYAGTDLGVFKSNDGGSSWVSSGLSSYRILDIVINPVDHLKIYVAAYTTGTFRSSDGGGTWTSINNGHTSVASLQIDQVNPSILYAGFIGSGVYKSIDGGDSWYPINNGLPRNYAGSISVTMVVIDPTNSSIVYASTLYSGNGQKVVYKSIDSGSSWSQIGSNLPFIDAAAIVIDPANTQNLYVSIYNNGVYKSTNGGAYWKAVNNGISNVSTPNLYITPSAPYTVYLSSDGIFKEIIIPTISGTPANTTTVGSAYEFTPTVEDATSITSTGNNLPPGLNLNPTTGILSGTPTTAGTYSGIIITATNANGSASLPAFTITVNPPAPTISGTPSTTATVGTSYAFTPTSTNAASFANTGNSLPAGLSINPTTGVVSGTPTTAGTFNNIIITATNVSGSVQLPAFSITVTAAQPWQVTSGPSDVAIYDLAVDPTNSQRIYVGTSGGVYRSTDGGASWNAANLGLENYTNSGPLPIQAVAVDSIGTIYAGAGAGVTAGVKGGVYKSTNGGTSWSVVNIGLSGITFVDALAIDPTDNSVIYAGTSGGVFKSANSGSSWSAKNSGLTNTDISSLAIDPADHLTLYAGAVAFNNYIGGVFKSIDGGNTWQAINTGLITSQRPFATVASLSVGPTGTVYAGTNSGGVYKSSDGGGGWSQVSSGLTFGGTFTSIASDPADSTAVYTGTNVGTLFGSTTAGASWTTLASGVTASRIYFNSRSGIWTNPATPTISGTPAGSATIGATYSFTPAATNATSFSITNKPGWASFNTTTGALSGTPTAVDAGTYSNMVISAVNGTGTVSLPAFSITVVSTNHAPVISGAPGTSDTAGVYYSFTPTATDADGNTLTYGIVNKPSWAVFNTATGTLSGTPLEAGTFGNIVISVSDGNSTSSLAPFSITVSPSGATATNNSTTRVPVFNGIWLLSGIVAGLGLLARRKL